MGVNSGSEWAWKTQKLKELLNQPLPGGRGFMHQRDLQIQRLCYEISVMSLPQR